MKAVEVYGKYNNTLLNAPDKDRCFGIHALDAHFLVDGYCNVNGTPCPPGSYERGSFEGLQYGIQSESVYGTRPFEVYDQDFTDCVIGVRVEAVDAPVITSNNFFIGGNDWTPDANEGIRLNGQSTGYLVTDNTFAETPNPVALSIGAGIRDVGGSNNAIQGNNFYGLYVASLSNGVNWNQAQPAQGHKWLCNVYDQDWGYDIAGVNTYNDPNIDEGVHPEQEIDPSTSAGNQFLFNNTWPESNYFNNANTNILYRPFQNNPPSGTPLDRSLSVSLTAQFGGLDCSTGEEEDEQMSAANRMALLNALATDETELSGLRSIYAQLIDGGSTPQTVSSIENNWNTIQELRTGLLGESPYLSQEALLEAMEKDILPLPVQMEVLLANPDVLSDKGFLIQLAEGIPSPIPAYLIEVLKSASSTETPRTILEQAISSKTWEIDAAVNRLIRDSRKESLLQQSDLRNLYSRLQGIEGKYLLAEQWLSENNLTEAQSAIQDLPLLFKLEGRNLEIHDRFVQWLNLIGNLKISGRNIFETTPTEKTILAQIAAANDGFASVKARNLLRFVDRQVYDVPMVLPTQNGQQQQRMAQDRVTSAKNEVKVFPNPASTYVVFECEKGNYAANTFLHITDALGREMWVFPLPDNQKQWVWNCALAQNGLYFYRIEVAGTTLAAGKITLYKP